MKVKEIISVIFDKVTIYKANNEGFEDIYKGNTNDIPYLIEKVNYFISCACTTYKYKHLRGSSIAIFKSPKEKIKRTVDNKCIEEVNKILGRLEEAYRGDEKIILTDDDFRKINNLNIMINLESKKSLIIIVLCFLTLVCLY